VRGAQAINEELLAGSNASNRNRLCEDFPVAVTLRIPFCASTVSTFASTSTHDEMSFHDHFAQVEALGSEELASSLDSGNRP
jgi:hypothetical protein